MDSHLHQCPGCQESVECSLAIGDPDCGKLRCADCSKPKLKPNTGKNGSAGHLLSNTWVCVNGCGQPENKVLVCPKCSAPKPAQVGTCHCGDPISEYYPDRCWDGHTQSGVEPPAPADEEEEEEESKVYTCSHCDEEHEDESEILICDYGSCSKEICTECCGTCDDCSKSLCEDHSNSCQCCHVTVCDGCRENHGA
jgi:hypothetical protein